MNYALPAPGPRSNFWLSLLLVSAVLGASMLYFLKETERQEKLRVREELNETVSLKKKLETEISKLKASTASLEGRLKSHEEVIATIKQNLDEQQLLRQKAEVDLFVKQTEIENLKNQIRKADDEKRDLQSRLEKQYEDYYNMKTQLSSILKTKEELEARAKELAENGPVSLGTVIIRQNR